MLAISLPADIDARLEALAHASGRSKADCALEAIVEYLRDLEDLQVAEQRLRDIRSGRTTPVPLADVLHEHGLDD